MTIQSTASYRASWVGGLAGGQAGQRGHSDAGGHDATGDETEVQAAASSVAAAASSCA
jgi:hypothetical protein